MAEQHEDEQELTLGATGAQSLIWETDLLGLDIDELGRRVASLFETLGHGSSSATVVLVDDATIAELNAQWREVEGPTDVLSFSMLEGDARAFGQGLLGDVVVSLETAARMVASGPEHRLRVADELGVAVDTLRWELLDEVTFLVIHGALHLIGHDHAEPQEEAKMRAEEGRLMAGWLRSTDNEDV